MRKQIGMLLVLAAGLLLPAAAKAQSAGGYTLDSFHSTIEIEQNTKLKITETAKVTFLENRHGIYRYIPTIYRNKDKMLNAHIRAIAAMDETGRVPFTTGQKGNDFYIKIGDANKYVAGPKTYTIIYEVSNMVARFEDHDELYWNAIGSGWDTNAGKATATVSSPFAKITKTEVFAGTFGSSERYGTSTIVNDNEAQFASRVPVGRGSDLTLVVALDKNNNLIFPTLASEIKDQIGLRRHYSLAFIPAIIMGLWWRKKGRDITSGYDKYLPYVYAPIKGISPAQAGILIDQRVNISDLTAEIIELARRKYIQIKKWGDDDFEFVKLKEPDDKLEDYQQYLLKELKPQLSKMKQKFYTQYAEYKKKVSANAQAHGWFDGSPENVRGKFTGMVFTIAFVLIWIMGSTKLLADGWLIFCMILSSAICWMFAAIMPRRTAEGHRLYHELTGLKYYINEGKWRMENFEKNLFIEEVLPIAIALGVVNRLTGQMKELGLQGPQYAAAFGPNFSGWGHFNSMASTSTIAPSKSGGWSGGSGFSGGSSGGGGGGGGGGSW